MVSFPHFLKGLTMKARLLDSLLILCLGLTTTSKDIRASEEKPTSQPLPQNHDTDDEINSLLKVMGELFEIGIPFPEQILELNLESIEDEEIASYLEKIILHIGAGKNTDEVVLSSSELAKLEFKRTLHDLDQLQKHECFLNLCLQIVIKKLDPSLQISGYDFFDHIKNLFSEEDRPKLKAIVDQLIKEEEIIRNIAMLKDGANRSQKIIKNFPANRRKGALELLSEVMVLNALYASLESSSDS